MSIPNSAESKPAVLLASPGDDAILSENELFQDELPIERVPQTNASLEGFAYMASHDLQEPLRTILLQADLFEAEAGDAIDPLARQFLAMVRNTCERMTTLVGDMLSYSRTANEEIPQHETISTRDALQTALLDLSASIRDSAAEISVPDDLPEVAANHSALTRVFQNLIGNSIKFRKSTEPCRIRVSAERAGNDWVFSIHDNGMGFDPAFADQIFVPFQRLHGRSVSGTGVGLATCKLLVEQQGGRIWAETQKDKGATFYFTLPAAFGRRFDAQTA